MTLHQELDEKRLHYPKCGNVLFFLDELAQTVLSDTVMKYSLYCPSVDYKSLKEKSIGEKSGTLSREVIHCLQ